MFGRFRHFKLVFLFFFEVFLLFFLATERNEAEQTKHLFKLVRGLSAVAVAMLFLSLSQC